MEPNTTNVSNNNNNNNNNVENIKSENTIKMFTEPKSATEDARFVAAKPRVSIGDSKFIVIPVAPENKNGAKRERTFSNEKITSHIPSTSNTGKVSFLNLLSTFLQDNFFFSRILS